jgi:hypothetical protein
VEGRHRHPLVKQLVYPRGKTHAPAAKVEDLTEAKFS